MFTNEERDDPWEKNELQLSCSINFRIKPANI